MEVKANVTITIERDGELVERFKVKNLITNGGLNWFRVDVSD